MGDYGTEGIKTTFLRDLVKRELLDHLSLCEGSKVSIYMIMCKQNRRNVSVIY